MTKLHAEEVLMFCTQIEIGLQKYNHFLKLDIKYLKTFQTDVAYLNAKVHVGFNSSSPDVVQ